MARGRQAARPGADLQSPGAIPRPPGPPGRARSAAQAPPRPRSATAAPPAPRPPTHRGGALLDRLLRVLHLEEVPVRGEDGDGAVVAHGSGRTRTVIRAGRGRGAALLPYAIGVRTLRSVRRAPAAPARVPRNPEGFGVDVTSKITPVPRAGTPALPPAPSNPPLDISRHRASPPSQGRFSEHLT